MDGIPNPIHACRGTAIGGVTLTGSMVAYGKLQVWPGDSQHGMHATRT
jgi:NAD/NADP transhydrogenase beta subunit